MAQSMPAPWPDETVEQLLPPKGDKARRHNDSKAKTSLEISPRALFRIETSLTYNISKARL